MSTTPTNEQQQQHAKWNLLLLDIEQRTEQVRQMKTSLPRLLIQAITTGVVGGLVVSLAACGPSNKERIAAFRKECQPAFTAAQCEVLTKLYAASMHAASDADVNADLAAASGLATGLAIGTAGRK